MRRFPASVREHSILAVSLSLPRHPTEALANTGGISLWGLDYQGQLDYLSNGGGTEEELNHLVMFRDNPEMAKEYFAKKLAESYGDLIAEVRKQELVAAEYHYGKLDTNNPARDYIASFVGKDLPFMLVTGYAGKVKSLPEWARKGFNAAVKEFAVHRSYETIRDSDTPAKTIVEETAKSTMGSILK